MCSPHACCRHPAGSTRNSNTFLSPAKGANCARPGFSAILPILVHASFHLFFDGKGVLTGAHLVAHLGRGRWHMQPQRGPAFGRPWCTWSGTLCLVCSLAGYGEGNEYNKGYPSAGWRTQTIWVPVNHPGTKHAHFQNTEMFRKQRQLFCGLILPASQTLMRTKDPSPRGLTLAGAALSGDITTKDVFERARRQPFFLLRSSSTIS